LTPVFPNGLVGTTFIGDSLGFELPCAFVMDPIGESIDPTPNAPAVLMKSRREKFPFSRDITKVLLCYHYEFDSLKVAILFNSIPIEI
jgi:hypothetical protein